LFPALNTNLDASSPFGPLCLFEIFKDYDKLVT